MAIKNIKGLSIHENMRREEKLLNHIYLKKRNKLVDPCKYEGINQVINQRKYTR